MIFFSQSKPPPRFSKANSFTWLLVFLAPASRTNFSRTSPDMISKCTKAVRRPSPTCSSLNSEFLREAASSARVMTLSVVPPSASPPSSGEETVISKVFVWLSYLQLWARMSSPRFRRWNSFGFSMRDFSIALGMRPVGSSWLRGLMSSGSISRLNSFTGMYTWWMKI